MLRGRGRCGNGVPGVSRSVEATCNAVAARLSGTGFGACELLYSSGI